MRILIAFTNYNRLRVSKYCAYQLFKSKSKDDRMVVYDDLSDEYNPVDVFKDRCDELAISVKRQGIHAQRRSNIKDFIERYTDYTHLYFTDNDALHDCAWRKKLYENEFSQYIVGLYNSPCHLNQQYQLGGNKEMVNRLYCPGISMLINRDMAKMCYDRLEEIQNWDFDISRIIGVSAMITITSYVEHIGGGGLHSAPNDFERDRAISPTDWLKSKRKSLLKKLLTK